MQPANLGPILHSDHSPIEGCSLFDRNHLLTFRPEPTDGGNPTTAPSFAALAQDLLGRVRDDLGVMP
ncbi:hypothetical protein CKJ76_10915 [Mycobacterium avium]|uniref:Uncharacterized protein n=1 Tax=Mycobacterium avium subsp. hominissuis TaxID=439334 RepID=A0A3B6X8U6_MYCAV|nr:hypothetical protein DFS55_14615 [Mycobacterium avium subsp. hominissuis]PBA71760.1 hypothetical protein CKJ76_10915 [Mycobacterium avium]